MRLHYPVTQYVGATPLASELGLVSGHKVGFVTVGALESSRYASLFDPPLRQVVDHKWREDQQEGHAYQTTDPASIPSVQFKDARSCLFSMTRRAKAVYVSPQESAIYSVEMTLN